MRVHDRFLRQAVLGLWMFLGLAGFSGPAGALELTTLDGCSFKDVTVVKIEPDGLSIKSSQGTTKLYFSNLPQQTRDQFGYDPARERAFIQAKQQQESARQTKPVVPSTTLVSRPPVVEGLPVKLLVLQTVSDGILAEAAVRRQVTRTVPSYSRGSSNSKSPSTSRSAETTYVPLEELIFVRQVSGLRRGDLWQGTIYPAGSINYRTPEGRVGSMRQYSLTPVTGSEPGSNIVTQMPPLSGSNGGNTPTTPNFPAQPSTSSSGPGRLPANPELDRIFSGKPAPEGVGSGFFISDDGYLVTNYHVVEGGHQFKVRVHGQLLPARLVKVNPAVDLALLKVEGSFHNLPLARSEEVKLGASVFTIGFPHPRIQGLEPKLTRGEISSLAGMKDDPHHFQVSVPIQPGNSGGPLIDSAGNVVGIIVAGLVLRGEALLKGTEMMPQNVNYAIKSAYALGFLQKMTDVRVTLRPPNVVRDRKLEEVVEEAEQCVAMIIVY